MNNHDGPMSFDAWINNSDFKRQITEMESRIKGMTGTAMAESRKMDNLITGIMAGAAGAFTFDAALDLRQKLIDVTGAFQKYEAILTNSLKSHEAAVDSMQLLKDMASSTPYQLDKLTESYVKLVNQGFKPTKAEITKLGDLSASVGKGFEQLTEAIIDAQTGEFERLKEFGIKTKNEGDNIIFTFRGISTEVKNSSEEIRNYILSLGDMEGIKGSMEVISKTLVGQVSNLEDAITNMFNEIGKGNEGLLSGSISALKFLVDNYQTIGKVLESLVITYGGYKAAVIALNVADRVRQAIMLEQALAGKALSAWEALHAIALKKVQAAQALLNKTMLANPYALVAAAIAAVISYMVIFRKRTEEISEAQQQFKTDATQTLAEVTTLFDQLKKTNAGTDERRKAIELLNSKYGEYIGNLNLEKATLLEIEKAEKLAKDAALDRMAAEGKIKDLADVNRQKISLLQTLQESGLSKEDIAEIKNYIEKPIDEFKTMNINGLNKAIPVFKSWGNEIDQVVDKYGNLLIYEKQIEKQWDDLREAIGAPITPGTTPNAPAGGDKTKKPLEDYKEMLRDMADEIEEEYRLIEKLSIAAADKEVDIWLEAVEKEVTAFDRKQNKQSEVLEQTRSLYNVLADIQEEYSEREKELRESAAPSELEGRLAELNRQKQAEIDAATDEALKKGAIYKKLTQVVISEGKKELITRIANIKEILDKEKMSADVRLELIRMLKEAENDLNEIALDNVTRKFNNIASILGSLSDLVGQFNDGIGKAAQDAAMLAGNLGQAVTGFMPGGDPIQGISGVIGALSSLASIITNVFGETEEDIDQVNRQIERMNTLLDAQMNILTNSVGTEKLDQYRKTLKLLEGDVRNLKQQINDMSFTRLMESFDEEGNKITQNVSVNNLLTEYMAMYGDINTAIARLESNISGGVFAGSEEKKQEMLAYLEELKSKQSELNALQQEYWEYVTGSTASALVDTIVEMFEQGKTSAADFADTFESLMSKALLQTFKIKMLEGPLTAWFENYAKGIAGGAYNTSYFLIGMQQQLEQIGEDAQLFWENLEKNFPGIMEQITGISSTGNTDLTGAVKGVTEETASLIAGQMNAIRMNQAEMLEQTRQSMMYLANIDRNTRELYPIRKAIDAINRKLKGGASSNDATGTTL